MEILLTEDWVPIVEMVRQYRRLHSVLHWPILDVERMRQQTEVALQTKEMTIEASQQLLQNYEQSLGHYTYLSV